MDLIGGAKIIKNLLKGDGALIGRFGTTEFGLLYYIENGLELTEDKRELLERVSGVFPCDVDSVKEWAGVYKKAICSADILALGWYEPIREQERSLLKSWGWRGSAVPLRSIEPYYVSEENRWTKDLSGGVCVVSSFAETASEQIKKNIWPSGMFEESIEWHWVRTGYPPSLALGSAGWETSAESWKEAVDWVVGEVMKTCARVVIIGCGGLGMLIGAELKRRGKVCIVMGGAIQVLFGIKGQRWKDHEIRKFWNSEWVWPAEDETPGGAAEVEGGCYWSSKTA